jgi:hypothetical protein|tara:strand:- start:40 stop:753 length:714 start_codon:yes stop_codon:yes gene_type:complete
MTLQTRGADGTTKIASGLVAPFTRLRDVLALRSVAILLEFAVPVGVLFVQLVLLREMDGVYFRDASGTLRYSALFVAASPAVLFYLLLRFVFRQLLASIIVIALTVIVRVIASLKLAMTNDTLSWTDISGTANLSVVIHYFSPQHALIVGAFLLLCAAAVYFSPRLERTVKGTVVQMFAILCFLPIALYSYADALGQQAGYQAREVMLKRDISYMPWDWERNIKRNGLLIHLVQTRL